MKLQIASRLAIFALMELAARPDAQVTVGEIGAKYGVSSHHLAKVMNVLSRAGLVRSLRGAAGGYQFSGDVRRTTLLDIIRLFENPTASAGPGEQPRQANDEDDALRQVLDEVDAVAAAVLGSTTIATMLKLVERHRRLPR